MLHAVLTRYPVSMNPMNDATRNPIKIPPITAIYAPEYAPAREVRRKNRVTDKLTRIEDIRAVVYGFFLRVNAFCGALSMEPIMRNT